MIRYLLVAALLTLLAACSSKGDQPPEAQVQADRLLQRGVAAYQQGDYLLATNHFTRALVDFQGFDQRSGQLQAHLNLAETLLQLGRLEAAREQTAIAQHLAAELQKEGAIEQAHWLLARLAWLEKNPELTLQELAYFLPEAARSIAADASGLLLSALALRTQLALELSDDGPAWLAAYQAAVEESPSSSHQLRLRRFQARELWQQGYLQAAEDELEAVLDTYRRQVNRPALAATLNELGQMYWQEGQLGRAEDSIKRALRIRLQMHSRLHASQLQDDLKKIREQQ